MLRKKIIILTDNKKLSGQAGYSFSEQGITIDKTIPCGGKNDEIEPGELEAYFTQSADIVLLMKNSLLQGFTKKLNLLGVYDLFVFPYDIQLGTGGRVPIPDDLIHIDNKKPRLKFIDVEITEHCNLKCKSCFVFSNLITDKKFLDLCLFKNNLLKLKELFWGVAMIHLQGGEPLLNPDYFEYVRITHEIFPDCNMQILTNGLLIPSIDISKLKALQLYNCTLNITQYPVLRKSLRKIKRYLNDAAVVYSLTVPRYIFAKKILLEPHKHPEIAYKNCVIKHCTGMQGNYLSPCMFPLHIYKFNKEFGCDLPETDKMDIYSIESDGWELLKALEEKQLAFCSYCHYGIVPVFWKQRKLKDAKPEDWLIKSNYFNSRLLPLFYRFAGPFLFRGYKSFSRSEGRFVK